MRPYVPILALLALISAPAAAQVTVLGESPAASCYQSAIAARSDAFALTDCEQALEHRQLPRRDRAATHINMGIVLLHSARFEDALASFDEAEALTVGMRGALAVNRSSALIRLGRYHDAIEQTGIAIEADEANLADAWFNRAMALERLGDIPGAYLALTRALEERPGWPMAEREMQRFSVEDGS
ncbi:tetratricopeptide repeat protein [Maricaulis sp.]|uniref:tetratricopeptide repeat protein n=1 Tax=Maricaulis sp. TaxID=1486257 RepID=UPI00261BC62B|nr:tetratricopeptide repeat protein [Maricaulis sp.]